MLWTQIHTSAHCEEPPPPAPPGQHVMCTSVQCAVLSTTLGALPGALSHSRPDRHKLQGHKVYLAPHNARPVTWWPWMHMGRHGLSESEKRTPPTSPRNNTWRPPRSTESPSGTNNTQLLADSANGVVCCSCSIQALSTVRNTQKLWPCCWPQFLLMSWWWWCVMVGPAYGTVTGITCLLSS